MSGKDETDGGVNKSEDSDLVFVRKTEIEIIDLDREEDDETDIHSASELTIDNEVSAQKNKNSQKIEENLNKLREIVEKGKALTNQNDDTTCVTQINGESVENAGTNMTTLTNCGENVSTHVPDSNIASTEENNAKKSVQANHSLSIDNDKIGKGQAVSIVTVKVEPIREGYPEIDPSQYRVKIEPGSEDDSNTSSESSSSSSESEEEGSIEKSGKIQRSRQSSTSSQNDKHAKFSKDEIRTKGEIFPEELPTIEDLTITVDDTVSLVHIGDVTSVVGVLAIVQSNQNMPPLNEETVIFLEGRVSCGKIFEVFGPVASPWYSLRFNSPEDVKEKGVIIGTKMYCAPKKEEYTNYVFVEHLKQIKGSDASWEDNNEPPDKFVDYSDDEEERRAKAKNRNKKQQENNDGDQLPGAKQRRKKQKQGSETNTEQQNNMTNQHHIRSNGPRKFAPFGGQLNRFQPRGSYQPRFPRQQFSQGSGLTSSSFQPLPDHSNGQFGYQNTGPHNTNFVPSAGPPIPDFTRPPPSFSWNRENSSRSGATFQSYVPQQNHMHGQTNNQTNYFPATNEFSSFQSLGSYRSNFGNMESTGFNQNFVGGEKGAYQSNSGPNSNNVNSVGPPSHGFRVSQSNNAAGDCNGFMSNNSSFPPPSQNGGQIIDNRYIQNAAFNQSATQSQPPRFGGQFGRYNQP